MPTDYSIRQYRQQATQTPKKETRMTTHFQVPLRFSPRTSDPASIDASLLLR